MKRFTVGCMQEHVKFIASYRLHNLSISFPLLLLYSCCVFYVCGFYSYFWLISNLFSHLPRVTLSSGSRHPSWESLVYPIAPLEFPCVLRWISLSIHTHLTGWLLLRRQDTVSWISFAFLPSVFNNQITAHCSHMENKNTSNTNFSIQTRTSLLNIYAPCETISVTRCSRKKSVLLLLKHMLYNEQKECTLGCNVKGGQKL